MLAHLVWGELGLPAAANKGHIVRTIEHFGSADASIEIFQST